ncbi:holo-ACP synthase [Staphylococcus sp. SQ8-PEA]|uniref:Holo-[acyl-carrier-protein] synthase n=1 Tax=Staphylococcus marylandisciuri TaxID=2981529 RepID=A0ABT2QRD5_9STAP|nr:holo-ACP synthase [Staphylococcus marylandisciuri]MCU5746544.1 holo-ACP synthase [Staphylococcus marylandisciuri]
MIIGIGIDLVEIERIANVYKRQPKFVDRILSSEEREKFNSFKTTLRQIEYLAGRFACKEAFSKAIGTGIGKEIAFNEINCYSDEKGKPCIDHDDYSIHVSITHTAHYAMSEVIIEK